MKLSEAKAVVTGGASGLGFASAQRVIDAGGQVVLFDINDELGAESAAKLGDRASYLNTNVADEASVKASIKQAAETMGGITLAVNCAGIATAGRALGEVIRRTSSAPVDHSKHLCSDSRRQTHADASSFRRSCTWIGAHRRLVCGGSTTGSHMGRGSGRPCDTGSTDHTVAA